MKEILNLVGVNPFLGELFNKVRVTKK